MKHICSNTCSYQAPEELCVKSTAPYDSFCQVEATYFSLGMIYQAFFFYSHSKILLHWYDVQDYGLTRYDLPCNFRAENETVRLHLYLESLIYEVIKESPAYTVSGGISPPFCFSSLFFLSVSIF